MPADESTEEVYSLRTLRKRGHLKVFLGYAPGVGKTFSMLAEAHRRAARGEDIVIGFVETHGRRETAELVEGLERVPLKRLAYRGKEFEELDTDAVIARRPEWVLIDEMAHTNVPGTRHDKRWQSVEEIQAAGINVVSTVNIQHFESLNDTVYDITGVRVQETLPDAVLDQADEVVLVDLTTAALLNRLRRGVVYDLDKIPGALSNFFKRENLVALRELALRKTAEEVDDFLERITAGEESLHPWVLGAACAHPRADRRLRSSTGGAALRAGTRTRRGGRRGRRRLRGRRDPAFRPPPPRDLHRPRPVAALPHRRDRPRFADRPRHPRDRPRGRPRRRRPEQVASDLTGGLKTPQRPRKDGPPAGRWTVLTDSLCLHADA
jgi:hypothetical protein